MEAIRGDLAPANQGPVREDHCRDEENKIDPDDDNSWTCGACNLPIFSTPLVVVEEEKGVYMHDCCANLPKELKVSHVHPNKPLSLTTSSHQNCCNICSKHLTPSTMMYHCADSMSCGIQLHVTCALPMWITILHRSHDHRFMVIRFRKTTSFICSACGTQHDDDKNQPSSSDVPNDDDMLIYVCVYCSFSIHPCCASLPNAINLHHHVHGHPLLLRYRKRNAHVHPQCRICRDFIRTLGMYSCYVCRYSVHIMCAVSHPHNFQPVLIQEARIPDLVRLPIANEHTSLIRHITNITSSTCDDDDVLKEVKYLHPHSLVLHHDGAEKNDDDDPRVCRHCFQFIFPPFYRCSKCPKFLLHNFCARLPHTLTQHIVHEKDHPILLSSEAVSATKSCRSCGNKCINGLSYSCKNRNVDLHVSCALMPASITHNAHATTHILYVKHFFEESFYNFWNYLNLTNPGEFKECDSCGTNTMNIYETEQPSTRVL